MHHLVVTGSIDKRKVGDLITDPAEIAKLENARGVVKVFAHLTHEGIAASAAAEVKATAKAPVEKPAPDSKPAAPAA